MENFRTILYEAVLVAFGKTLAKYDVFTQGVIMRDIGKEILSYMGKSGYPLTETGSVQDLQVLIDLFVKNGFAEKLEITPADKGDTYIWTNLYGGKAYKELYDLALNPFLACPLNLCMCYVTGKYNKKLLMHRKIFKSETVTEAQYELVDDDDLTGSLDGLVLQSARMFEIADEKQKLFHHLSITDTLTGLHNLRHIQEEGKRIFQQAQLNRQPIASLVLDIDHFKRVNDTFGHSAGDAVLRSLGDLFRQSLRETDLVARYGGEEFIVILPNTQFPAAMEIAERLRKSVEQTAFGDGKGNQIHITISIGIAHAHTADIPFELFLQHADHALFQAKHQGRNQTIEYKALD
jgi:diguanylate cyclase (GGDEF)-like protein